MRATADTARQSREPRTRRLRRSRREDEHGWPIELIDVRKAFGSHRVLRGVSFDAPPGAVTVLVGAQAAGKTTTVRMILGLDRPDDGAILVAGEDVSRARERRLRALREGVSVMFQGATPAGCGLFDSATVHENVAFPLRHRNQTRREGLLDNQANEYLERVGLLDVADAQASTLNESARRCLALARALALRSPVTILDDFGAGLEAPVLDSVIELVRGEQLLHRGTYLLTTRDASLGTLLGDSVVVLDGGRVDRDPFARR